jgi:hypothetical protein
VARWGVTAGLHKSSERQPHTDRLDNNEGSTLEPTIYFRMLSDMRKKPRKPDIAPEKKFSSCRYIRERVP